MMRYCGKIGYPHGKKQPLGWSEEEKVKLLQLKGKAFQEWNLMSEHDRKSFSTAATKLKETLYQGCQEDSSSRLSSCNPEAKGKCIRLYLLPGEDFQTRLWEGGTDHKNLLYGQL